MKHTVALAFASSILYSVLPFASTAQIKSLPKQEQEHILVSEKLIEAGTPKMETLSGINLHATTKGEFQLDFSQELKENAVLEIKNKAGQTVFQKPVTVDENKYSWSYNVGKLKPDTYLIEIKTSDTTYWTKFKIEK